MLPTNYAFDANANRKVLIVYCNDLWKAARISPKRVPYHFQRRKCSFFLLYLSQSNRFGAFVAGTLTLSECTRISHFQKENSKLFWGRAQPHTLQCPIPLGAITVGLRLTCTS